MTELPRPASLELRGAGFSFPGAEKAVLTDISFRVAAGETLAIIGSTGSGKTALLSLVVRLFDVTAGQALVNGVDVRDLDPDALHRRWGSYPRSPSSSRAPSRATCASVTPMPTTKPCGTRSRLRRPRDFVAAMPGGLDARISQGGGNVSGGQRQRLAIARALAHRPEIYLFDDSFSALDLATDPRLRGRSRRRSSTP